jgi:hypothetical protein
MACSVVARRMLAEGILEPMAGHMTVLIRRLLYDAG